MDHGHTACTSWRLPALFLLPFPCSCLLFLGLQSWGSVLGGCGGLGQKDPMPQCAVLGEPVPALLAAMLQASHPCTRESVPVSQGSRARWQTHFPGLCCAKRESHFLQSSQAFLFPALPAPVAGCASTHGSPCFPEDPSRSSHLQHSDGCKDLSVLGKSPWVKTKGHLSDGTGTQPVPAFVPCPSLRAAHAPASQGASSLRVPSPLQ